MTCCFFSLFKTLLTVTEDSVLTSAFNVLDDGLQLAGFQVTLTGRFWVTPEETLTLKALKARFAAVGRFAGVWDSESHELSRFGKPVHCIEKLQRIVGWFDKYLQGKPMPIYDIPTEE